MTEQNVSITPINLSNNELKIVYSNIEAIQAIYEKCLIPLFEKRQLRVHHMPSVLIALAQIDKALSEINDKVRYQTSGKRKMSLIRINKLHEQNKVLKDTIQRLTLAAQDESLSGRDISLIEKAIADCEKEILDNNEMIEIQKLTQEYKVYEWDKVRGIISVPHSEDFIKSAMIVLKNVGLTVEGSKFLEAELDATIISMFTDNMLDE